MALARRWPLLLAAVVLLVHLPALLRWGAPLPEDGPALSANPALAWGGERSLAEVVSDVFVEPTAAWANAGDTVGRTRWRPLGALAYAAERRLLGGSVLSGVVVLAVMLHLLVVLQAAALARDMGADVRWSRAAALLTALAPTSLCAVGWPARHDAVLACALGLVGLRAALAPGAGRRIGGGLLLAAAGLVHEAAFGFAAALPLVVASRSLGGPRPPDSGRTGPSGSVHWGVTLAPAAVAYALRAVALSRFMGEPLLGPEPVRALGGAVTALAQGVVSVVLPARLRLADAGWDPNDTVGAVGALGLLVLVVFAVRRRSPAALAALAAAAAFLPAALEAGRGASPPRDEMLFPSVPLLCAAFALLGCRAAARGRHLRMAAVAAAALLLGASAGSTVMHARSFADRAAFVRMAAAEAPGSPLARSWLLLEDLREAEAGEGAARQEAVAALGPRVEKLGLDVSTAAEAGLGRDGVASATVGSVLARAALGIANAGLPEDHAALEQAQRGLRGAEILLPGEARTWVARAVVLGARGGLRAAIDAALRARELAPADQDVARIAADLALELGSPADAVVVLEEAAARCATASVPLGQAFRVSWARALAGDGRRRRLSADGWHYQYDRAVGLLEEILGDSPAPNVRTEAVRMLHEVLLRYGDFLTTADRPVLGRAAYERALEVFPGAPTAEEHLAWLVDRLAEEEAAAQKAVELAAANQDPQLANEIVRLGVVYCRQGRWRAADDLFRNLGERLGGIPPALRLVIAVNRHARRPPSEDQKRALAALDQVLREDPTLVQARFEKGKVLMALGSHHEARAELRRAAHEGVDRAWMLEAVELAEELDGFLGPARE